MFSEGKCNFLTTVLQKGLLLGKVCNMQQKHTWPPSVYSVVAACMVTVLYPKPNRLKGLVSMSIKMDSIIISYYYILLVCNERSLNNTGKLPGE